MLRIIIVLVCSISYICYGQCYQQQLKTKSNKVIKCDTVKPIGVGTLTATSIGINLLNKPFHIARIAIMKDNLAVAELDTCGVWHVKDTTATLNVLLNEMKRIYAPRYENRNN